MYGNIRKVLHTGVSVGDMDGSVAWYRRNLGFYVVSDEYVPPLGARVVFLRRDDLDYEIELFRYDDPKALPEDRLHPDSDIRTIGTKHVAFQVDDMEALRRDFLSNGVDIAHEVRMGNDAVMFIRDCNGVLIEFIQKQEAVH